MKVSKGLGGMGAVTMAEPSMPHPNSHFEMKEMRIKKADDGSFVMEHRMELKKKHEGKSGYSHGYRDSETHTAANVKEVMAHVSQHFGGAKKSKEMVPQASAEDEAGERADEE